MSSSPPAAPERIVCRTPDGAGRSAPALGSNKALHKRPDGNRGGSDEFLDEALRYATNLNQRLGKH